MFCNCVKREISRDLVVVKKDPIFFGILRRVNGRAPFFVLY